jgi:hypothetical protein
MDLHLGITAARNEHSAALVQTESLRCVHQPLELRRLWSLQVVNDANQGGPNKDDMPAEAGEPVSVRRSGVTANVTDVRFRLERDNLAAGTSIAVNLTLAINKEAILGDGLLSVLRVKGSAVLRVSRSTGPSKGQTALEDRKAVLIRVTVTDSAVRRRLEGHK